MQYHCIDTEWREIKEDLAILQAQLSLNNEALNGCRYHIEVSRVPHMLHNLQGQSDFLIYRGEQLGRRTEGHPQAAGPGVSVWREGNVTA